MMSALNESRKNSSLSTLFNLKKSIDILINSFKLIVWNSPTSLFHNKCKLISVVSLYEDNLLSSKS